MSKYRIKVKIEFEECDENNEQEPQQKPNGAFEMIINEKDAASIDKSDKALLSTAYPAIRQAIADHLNCVSKKKRLKKQETE